MQISVAMATYNGARYIGEQLDSIARQTMAPAELVVSDDGSSDDTLAIVETFARHAPFPVRIVAKDARLGFADNFLHAAAACRHDLVAFSDHDDVWLPRKLETGFRRIVGDRSLLSMHRLTVTDAALAPVARWDQEIAGDAVYEPLALDPYITGWGNTMLFRRELAILIPRARRPRQPESRERPLSHDTWIYALAAALGRVSHIAAPLILYRQHGRNVFGVDEPSLLRKLAIRTEVPITRFHAQAEFDGAMAALLGEVGERTDTALAAPARIAAARFAERRDFLAGRTAIYRGGSVRARLHAYRTLRDIPGDGMTAVRSRAKDLLLGVTGLGKRLAS